MSNMLGFPKPVVEAAQQYRQQLLVFKEQVDSALTALSPIVDEHATSTKPKRVLSAEGRKHISEGIKLHWKRIKAAKKAAAVAAAKTNTSKAA